MCSTPLTSPVSGSGKMSANVVYIFLVALNIKYFVGFDTMQHIFLAVLLQSLTKQPSKCQICGEGVLGFSVKQIFSN